MPILASICFIMFSCICLLQERKCVKPSIWTYLFVFRREVRYFHHFQGLACDFIAVLLPLVFISAVNCRVFYVSHRCILAVPRAWVRLIELNKEYKRQHEQQRSHSVSEIIIMQRRKQLHDLLIFPSASDNSVQETESNFSVKQKQPLTVIKQQQKLSGTFLPA